MAEHRHDQRRGRLCQIGEVDLSDLKGRGVFTAWEDERFFRAVHLAAHGAVEWGNDIDLCPDALYVQLTGQSPKICFPR